MAGGGEPARDVATRLRPGRRWLAGCVVVLGTAAVVLPLSVGGGGVQIRVALVLVALTVIARLAGESSAVRALVFLDVVFWLFAAGDVLSWPPAVTTVLVCICPLSVLIGCNRLPWLRPTTPWLRPGGVTGTMLALGCVTVVAAGVALTMWATVVRPEPAPYLRELQDLPMWLGVAGVAGFALVNPIWEEVLFRGVVLHELTQIWSARVAVVAQALLFGAAHWAGFPSGWFGMLMAATWGFVLGIIRVRSGGIGLTYAIHVGANAVIGALALILLN